MLTPEVLEYILNSLEVHKRLQESVIRDIVRRIVKNGVKPADNLTEGAVYQIEMAQRAGILYDDIVQIVAEESDSVYYDIKNAFDAAEVEILNFDDEVLLDNGYEPEVVKNLSPGMRQIWEAAFEKTFTDAKNLTKTIALTTQSAFISACDLAHMQVASGSFTYQQAIANAVMQAASGGVKVLYPSGASASLDYAVRRAVLTSVNQTGGTIMLMRANELDHDLMETTAHYGAREEHAVWQGQVVSRSGQSGYLSLSDVGYGDVTGIFGANCRHNWFMFFGARTYTDEQLEEMKNATVTYNGTEMSYYGATQKQRSMERAVKKTKRELVGLDEAMKNLPADQQMDLKVDFMNKSGFLKEQEAKLSNFCSQTGLKRDRFREQVFSTETENGIKRWTKSTSSKAVWGNQKALTIKRENDIIKEIKACGIQGEIHLKPTPISIDVLEFDDAHINKQRAHNITEDEAKSFIRKAKISSTVWKGKFERYYSEEGAAYVNLDTMTIRTAYGKWQFGQDVKDMLEVLKKYGI